MIKKLTAVLLCALILFTCASCSAGAKKTNGDFNIVASFYPMYIFTLNLVKGLENVNLSCLAQQDTGCLHNYQLSTSDMKVLSNADMFIINGGGMETFIEDVTAQLPDLKIVTASDGITMISEEHSEGEESGLDNGHEHGENAHVWLSVANARKQISNIASAMRESLPEHSDIITKNEDSYLERLDALLYEVSEAKLNTSGLSVVSLHEAYEYFASDLNLNIVSSIETDDGTEPGTKELTEIVDLMKANSVSVVLLPPEYTGNAGNVLVHETGAVFVKINPITSGIFSLSAYEDMMRENINAVSEAVN